MSTATYQWDKPQRSHVQVSHETMVFGGRGVGAAPSDERFSCWSPDVCVHG